MCAAKGIPGPCNLDSITTYLKEDMGVILMNVMVGSDFVGSTLERMYELSSCNGYDEDCSYAGAYSDFNALEEAVETLVCDAVQQISEALVPHCTFTARRATKLWATQQSTATKVSGRITQRARKVHRCARPSMLTPVASQLAPTAQHKRCHLKEVPLARSTTSTSSRRSMCPGL